MTKLQAIRQEYDEPLRDIFRGYALMGYSIAFTASVLGISKSYAQEAVIFYGCRPWFDRNRYVRECKGGPTRETWKGGRPKGRKRG